MILSSVLRLCSKPRSGWHGYANAPCRPLDARVSCLIRFLLCRLLPEGSFLFTSSRFGLLRTSVPERSASLAVHTSPPGFSLSCDFDPPRSRIVTLLPPLSPPSVRFQHCCLSLLWAGFDCSLLPSPGSQLSIAASSITCTGLCLRSRRPTFYNSTFMGSSPLGP